MTSTELDEVALGLRSRVQTFTRRFGLLRTSETPCGKPIQPSHAHALLTLAERARAARSTLQKDLADVLGLDKSSVTRLCQRMERDGHVRLAVHDADARARVLTLTAKGARLAAEVDASSRAKFERVVGRVAPGGRALILEALDHLNAALDAASMGGDR